MGRTPLRAAAVVTLAALFAGTATAATAAIPGEVIPGGLSLPSGQYIVVLDEEAAASYSGGEAGLAPTRPAEGEKLDASSPAVKRYIAFLERRQESVAQSVGATTDASYQVALNGFSATLTAAQASKLATTTGVEAIYPDEILHPDATRSTEYIGLEGAGGVWESVGGIDDAGKGVVVGVVDTGISPENPSFAGDELGTTPGAEPYLDGNEIVFTKADGEQFRSERVTGEDWELSDYSTKIIGAQYFSTGAANAGFDFGPDYLSPRDFAGHGSHTASTAAGENGVDAVVNGIGYGQISGVAPAAKVAAYKACYDGPDPDVTSDDICASSDLLAAINAAVVDGVDVINFSIGGGAATSVATAFDVAFLNAAVAGVFVSASAGNSGPGASTADHASPWYTTVANSTMPSETATLVLGNGEQAAGLTIGLPAGVDLSAGIVYAPDASLPGLDASQCFDDTLDPALVAGKIVVCERGGNFLYQKADETLRAGGIATIILNTPTSAATVFGGSYSLPTVHIPVDFYAAITGYITGTTDPTASIVPGNSTAWVAPAAPVVNSSSSRGPALAAGSDVIKPDITAPGTDVLAATANGSADDPTWNFYTGTSMAAPHVAGLAALYLGVHPAATPGEIKSAIMTTAFDTKYEDGSTNTNPFDQGAGHIDPTRFLEPGLVYLNGVDDWYSYLQGLGYEVGAPAIDPSDLNLASIAVGTLATSQTVTRSVTSTQAGTFTAAVSVPGFDAVVTPSTLTFGAAGETQPFTVTLTRTTAPAEEWSTGFLTWTSGDTSVRSPIALFPVTAEAPALVEGEGTSGSIPVTITSGIDGELPLVLGGLALPELLTDPEFPVEGHTGDQDSFYDEEGSFNNYFYVDVAEGTAQTRFTLDSGTDDGSADLDLVVYYIDADGFASVVGQSAGGTADELVVLDDPDAGTYVAMVNRYSYTDPFTWDLTALSLQEGVGAGSLTATPNPLTVTSGADAAYTLSWSGLQPNSTYFGFVQYGDSAVRTLVSIDSGAAAPVATVAPKVTGTPKVGKTLTATAGTWDPADVTVTYQWLRSGAPIDGATANTYKVVKADEGSALSVRVTATAAGNINPGVADSNALTVKYTSSVAVSMNRYLGTSSQSYAVTVTVKTSGGPAATGTVTVTVGSKKYTGTLVAGKVTIQLSAQKKGVHVVVATFAGSATIAASSGVSGFYVYR